jgi:hypothetical protein
MDGGKEVWMGGGERRGTDVKLQHGSSPSTTLEGGFMYVII